MTYTITTNAEHNGIEITFTAKPSEAVREALKALKFRWHGVKKLWYGRAAAETVKAAIESAEAGTKATTETKNTTKKTSKPDQDRIRIYYNGIKLDGGKLIRCGYSLDNNATHEPSISIYARDYDDLPRDLLPVENDTDSYTDYFDKDHAYITPTHPLYKCFRYAAEKARARESADYIKYLENSLKRPEVISGSHARTRADIEQRKAFITAFEAMEDPGQPTAADLAEIDRAAQEAETAKLARREEYLITRCNARRLIETETAAHPLRENTPRVTIKWSESPAFDGWGENALVLSLKAAENIFRKLDTERHESGAGGYDKTAFLLEWKDEKGEAHTYTGRYDLGDNDGGLIAHIRAFVNWALSRTSSTNPDDIEAHEEAERLLKLLEDFNV